MPLLVPRDDEDGGAAALKEDEKLPDVTMSMDLLDDVGKDGSQLMETNDRPISRPVVFGTVPKIGLIRVPEVTGDDPEPEADYDAESKHDSPLPDAVPDQPDVAASPRIFVAPNISEAASFFPPITPQVPNSAFSDHPFGPQGITSVYHNYRCTECDMAFSGYFIRQTILAVLVVVLLLRFA